MSHRKGAAVLAASALLACAGLVRAAEPQAAGAASASGLSLDKPVLMADTGPADSSLMGVADKLGVGKPLNDFGLVIGGEAVRREAVQLPKTQIKPRPGLRLLS